ncbi:MAG TPA: helix-turn-helix domain-containing protein [Alphaproteobacteria bacterium]|nr:helix-turn-helix domain-containing protein [Alphaproteobacteria bacterium]
MHTEVKPFRDVKPLRSEADYDAALEDIAPYFEREPEPGTPEGDRFDLLALVIEDYERKHWPIDPPDPVEAIKDRMERAGYRQADLAALIGSRSRASEILNRKRPLTLETIWKLAREWRIPAESLIRPYRAGPGMRAAAARKRVRSRTRRAKSASARGA